MDAVRFCLVRKCRKLKKDNQKRREKNLQAEKTLIETKKALIKEASKNPWERVMANIDMKEGGYKGTKDILRMKQVMASRKEALQKRSSKP